MTYIFDEWIPNPYLLIVFFIMFLVTTYLIDNILTMVFFGLTIICLGWSITFSKKKFVSHKELEEKE